MLTIASKFSVHLKHKAHVMLSIKMQLPCCIMHLAYKQGYLANDVQ